MLGLQQWLFVILAFVTASPSMGAEALEQAVEQRLQSIRADPNELRAFFHDMPKGGDLGLKFLAADYAENLIEVAASKDLCFNPDTRTLSQPPCGAPALPLKHLKREPDLYRSLVRAWSLFDFDGNCHALRAHIQGIPKMIRQINPDHATLLTNLRKRAARENLTYLEIAVGWPNARRLAHSFQHSWKNMEEAWKALPNKEFQTQCREMNGFLTQCLKRSNEQLNKSDIAENSRVEVRFLCVIPRNLVIHEFWAEAALAFAVAAENPKVVGVSLAGSEEDVLSFSGFDQQMKILAFLALRFPAVRRSYNAGELVAGRVPPDHLGTHIRQTFELAKAQRIGDGADISYATDMHDLLADLADNRVAVEVALTGDQKLLGLAGSAHPLPLYHRNRVPVVLITREPGIYRTDLTDQYVQAATRYPRLKYTDFKTMARNSLEYSFMEGKSLWEDGDYRTRTRQCVDTNSQTFRAYLKKNQRAIVQWRLEQAFFDFESRQQQRFQNTDQ